MRHIFAEADVTDNNQAGDLALDGADSLLDDAVFLPGATRDFVFLFR